jgi:hypothetical protein
MKSALIGYTGFVGQNIDSQYHFTDKYNSSNIKEIIGREYDLVVSAANRAEMWRINQNPEADLAEINDFIQDLTQVKIKKLVLISTVGVYKNPNGANEDTTIDTEGLLPYGANRYRLEQFCTENFDTTIIRLPGLFGKGLKKNVIFDLLHSNNVENIHKDGVYQYYNLDNIWKDISVALDNNLPLVNLASEPVSTELVAQECFEMEFNNTPAGVSPAFWDMRSKYAECYDGKGEYLYTKQQVLKDIKMYVQTAKKGLS